MVSFFSLFEQELNMVNTRAKPIILIVFPIMKNLLIEIVPRVADNFFRLGTYIGNEALWDAAFTHCFVGPDGMRKRLEHIFRRRKHAGTSAGRAGTITRCDSHTVTITGPDNKSYANAFTGAGHHSGSDT